MPAKANPHAIRASIPQATPSQVVEVAAYTIKPQAAERFPAEIHPSLMEWVRRQGGFVRGLSLRGIEDKRFFADYVVWSSLEDARRAAGTLEKTELHGSVMGAVDTMRLFGHYQVVDRVDGEAAPGDTFELAAYVIQENSASKFTEALPALFARVAEQQGFVAAQRSRSLDSPTKFLDVLQWSTLEDATAAAEAVHQTPECAAAFAHLERDELFEHAEAFRVIEPAASETNESSAALSSTTKVIAAMALLGLSTPSLLGGCKTGSSPAGKATSAQPSEQAAPATAPAPASASVHKGPGDLAKSPMRNDIKAVLNAPVKEVWALVSDHRKLPTYSAGIRDVTLASRCDGPGGGVGCVRTCTFHEGPALEERVVSVEEPHLLATSAVEPNDYQLTNDLTLVTLRAFDDDRTEFWWRQYYDHPKPEEMKPVFDEALLDLAQKLVKRFGGSVKQ